MNSRFARCFNGTYGAYGANGAYVRHVLLLQASEVKAIVAAQPQTINYSSLGIVAWVS
jgi:hypothetical protein